MTQVADKLRWVSDGKARTKGVSIDISEEHAVKEGSEIGGEQACCNGGQRSWW